MQFRWANGQQWQNVRRRAQQLQNSITHVPGVALTQVATDRKRCGT